MQMPQRLLSGEVRQVLIKVIVLLVSDGVLRFNPDRRLVIDVLRFQINGMRYKRRILPQNVLQSNWLREFLHAVFQMQSDTCAACERFGHVADRECAVTTRFPTPAGVFGRAASYHFDTICQHERGIESNTELTDERQIGRFFARLLRLLQEVERTAAGDRTEIAHEFIMRHSNPVVANYENTIFFIWFDRDS